LVKRDLVQVRLRLARWDWVIWPALKGRGPTNLSASRSSMLAR
jgi:hypothetical protein